MQATNKLEISGELRTDAPFTELYLSDGRIVRLPTSLLVPERPQVQAEPAAFDTVIPVIEETMTVSKQTVETGKVLLHKRVREVEQGIDESLAVHSYEVERVAIHQEVDATPETRREGATTIYPIVEERLILTKQLVLVEELRVTERITERRDTRVIRLKREDVEVERVPVEQVNVPGSGLS